MNLPHVIDYLALISKYFIFCEFKYFRNLPTHTVNNLQQKLNDVFFSFKILLLNKNSIFFTSCVEISEQYLGYNTKCSLFNLKGSKSKVTKIGI